MRVFLTKPIPQAGINKMEQAGIQTTVNTKMLSQEQLIQACQKYDAIVGVGFANMDAQFLQACKHLKLIALFAVGYDNVDLREATKLKIPVSNTPDVLSKATADTAFLLMIAVSRKAFYNYKKILDGKWSGFEPVADLGMALEGKTLGIFGLGKIGMEMAKRCQAAFGMRVIYHNRNRNEKTELELGATYVSFDELLAQSDVLSLHANYSPSVKEIFNQAAFAKMKPSAIFINTARGAMHHEADLKEALDHGIIWGSGLDVTNPEPMDKNNPLLLMPNVCVLPHIGSATQEARNAMSLIVAENIIAGLKGAQLPTIVNKEVYL